MIQRIGIVLLALAAPVAIASEASQSRAPELAAGATIDAGQWRVKPLRARIAAEHPIPRSWDGDQRYLLVDVELTNLMDRSSFDFIFVLRVEQPNLPELKEPSFVLVRDNSLPDRLHPDMPEVMTAVWPWPANAPAPTEVRLSITAKTFKPVDNLAGSPGWFNPKIVAITVLPMGQE